MSEQQLHSWKIGSHCSVRMVMLQEDTQSSCFSSVKSPCQLKDLSNPQHKWGLKYILALQTS